MKLVLGETFRGADITLANKEYRKCTFVDCHLVYEGAPVELIECKFLNSGFNFQGPARHTIRFLHHMWVSGGANVVGETGVNIVGSPISFGD